jgi:hypothetical protein
LADAQLGEARGADFLLSGDRWTGAFPRAARRSGRSLVDARG